MESEMNMNWTHIRQMCNIFTVRRSKYTKIEQISIYDAYIKVRTYMHCKNSLWPSNATWRRDVVVSSGPCNVVLPVSHNLQNAFEDISAEYCQFFRDTYYALHNEIAIQFSTILMYE